MNMKRNSGGIGIFEIILAALALIVLAIFLFKNVGFFIDIKNFFTGGVDYGAVGNVVKFILTILTIFFLTIIAYCAVRLLEIRKKEHEHLAREIAEYAHKQSETERKKQEGGGVSDNSRRIKVLEHTFSQNPADWKLAIIESDSMLLDLMEQMGFKGENLGEKLKNADQESFPSLTRAWEVHTIRNRIAHEGLAFEVSNFEAKRVVAIYEQIFREYGYI